MSLLRNLLSSGVAAMTFSAAFAAEPVAEDGRASEGARVRAELVERIDAALAGDAGGDASERSKALRETAEAVLKAVPANVLVGEALGPAVDEAAGQDDAARLRKGLEEAKTVLAFEPTMEAPLPEGFPEPTPVGEIRVKEYPAYRLAKTPAVNDSVAFFTLFGHIQKNDIAMTAPVEMTLGEGSDKPRMESMAFLYRSVRQGTQGRQGIVEVVDVPAGKAVAIGLRGDIRDERTAGARKRLEAWLKEHPEYEPAGPPRVMGYNGPSVPVGDRFFEVEVPVRGKAGEGAGS